MTKPEEPAGQGSASGELAKLEMERLALAVEKLTLADEKFKLAKEKKFDWTPLSLLASVVVAAGAYLSAQNQQMVAANSSRNLQKASAKADQTLQEQAATHAFRIKVVEIAMTGTAHEAQGKLEVLKQLFPKQFEEIGTFDANKTSWGRASKYKILDLIAAHEDPKQRRIIIETYDALFNAIEKEKPWFTKELKNTVVSGNPGK